MARVVLLDTAFSDGPILQPDRILPSASGQLGALMLVDPTHPADPWPAGVPADQALLPNIAWEMAQSTLANGQTQSTLKPKMQRSGFTSPLAIAERGSKGSLHGIVTQSAATGTSNFWMALTLPDPIVTYVSAHDDHDFYVSWWGQITRIQPGAVLGQQIPFASFARSSSGEKGLFMLGQNGLTKPTATDLIGSLLTNQNTLGTMYASFAGSSNEDMVDTNFAAIGTRALAAWGVTSPWASSAGSSLNQWPSKAFRRFYLEDITVSGRTYAEIDAIDQALFADLVDASGGRYNGEVLTSPSVLP